MLDVSSSTAESDASATTLAQRPAVYCYTTVCLSVCTLRSQQRPGTKWSEIIVVMTTIDWRATVSMATDGAGALGADVITQTTRGRRLWHAQLSSNVRSIRAIWSITISRGATCRVKMKHDWLQNYRTELHPTAPRKVPDNNAPSASHHDSRHDQRIAITGSYSKKPWHQ